MQIWAFNSNIRFSCPQNTILLMFCYDIYIWDKIMKE